MKKLIVTMLVVVMLLSTGILTAAAAEPPPYNGTVDGAFTINETTGAFTAELTGDYTCTITGYGIPDASDPQITNFTGTMTGDIESSENGVVGKINANGQDSLFAVISGTGASEPVYLMGEYGAGHGDIQRELRSFHGQSDFHVQVLLYSVAYPFSFCSHHETERKGQGGFIHILTIFNNSACCPVAGLLCF